MEHDKFRSRCGGGKRRRDNDDDSEEDDNKDDVERDDRVLSFDDSKLYQLMLKDFISNSSGGSFSNGHSNKRAESGFDPAHEAAERLKRAMRKKSGGGDLDLASLLTSAGDTDGMQNTLSASTGSNANSKKSTVDRRASKGRKIRYVVHPKLVNFTFPIARKEPMIPEDVWFKSMFGGVGNIR